MPAPINLPPRATTEALNTLDGNWLDTALGWATTVPSWIWATALAGTFLATLVAFPVLRRQAYKAGRRAAGHTIKPGSSVQDRRDRQLLAAALGPAILFWIAVLIGSARGLIGFARDDLNWTGGWEYLVPFTLDGVAVTFGFLAFRAISKERNPDRAYRIVWMATTASAGINFLHEVNGSTLGALYLSILSLFGMLIFHEFLAQFEEGAAWIKRDNPKFGLRWTTWPTNTLCAWFAWRNYPPANGTEASIANAVKHLDGVRDIKRVLRAERAGATPWWTPVMPWVRVRQLDATITALRDRNAADSARRDADIATLAAQLTGALVALTDSREDLTAARTELTDIAGRLDAVNADHEAMKRSLADITAKATAQAEKDSERINDLTAELAKASTVNLGAYREQHTKSAPARPRNTSPQPGNRPAVTDETAVQMMLTAHRDPAHVWSQNSVRTLTGAGFPRIPRLIDLWHTAVVEQANGEEPGEQIAVNQ